MTESGVYCLPVQYSASTVSVVSCCNL